MTITNSPQKFNFETANQYLEWLDPKAEAFEFRAIWPKERGDAPQGRKSMRLRGTLRGLLKKLWDLNLTGYGIFVTINATDGTGVKAENVTQVRACFADFDNGVPGDLFGHLPPSVLVQTSAGKYQALWLLDEGENMTPNKFADVESCLVQDWRADPNARDIARVLRVPGFIHTKDAGNKISVILDPRTTSDRPDGVPVYSTADLIAAFPRPSEAEPARASATLAKLKSVTGISPRLSDVAASAQDIDDLRAALDHIGAATNGDAGNYGAWVAVILALKEEVRTGWLQYGTAIDLIESYSAHAGSKALDRAGIERKWADAGEPDGTTGRGALFKRAEALGLVNPSRGRRRPPTANVGALPGDSAMTQQSGRSVDDLKSLCTDAINRARNGKNATEIMNGQALAVMAELQQVDPVAFAVVRGEVKTALRPLGVSISDFDHGVSDQAACNKATGASDTDAVMEQLRERFTIVQGRQVRVHDAVSGNVMDGRGFLGWAAQEFGMHACQHYLQSFGDAARATGFTFVPEGERLIGGDPRNKKLNTWQPWTVRRGGLNTLEASEAGCGNILNFIWEVVASEQRDLYGYLINWLAWAVQNPSRPAGTAIVLRSEEEGTGKSVFADEIARALFAPHAPKATSARQLAGTFNATLADAVLVHLEEAEISADASAVFRSLVTSNTVRIERKGQDAYEVPSSLKLIATTNRDIAVAAGKDDRRWVIIDVSPARKGDKAYFTALVETHIPREIEAFASYLQLLDLRGWRPDAQRPRTKGLLDQKIAGLNGFDRLWFDCLQRGELVVGDGMSPMGRTVLAADGARVRWTSGEVTLSKADRETIMAYLNATARGTSKVSIDGLSKHAAKYGIERKRLPGGVRERVWVVPALSGARHAFEQVLGQQIDWD